MAIVIYKFQQPYLELELVAGGSLDITKTYYFLAYYQKTGGYYHCSHGPCSEEQSISPTAGNQSIKTTWWVYHNDITAFADAGGGQVTVTSVGHGRANSDSVKIIGTTNYNGTFIISNVTTDTFEITNTWVSDDGTGKWLHDNGICPMAQGINLKWDYYTMMNGAVPYPWQNLNDPAMSEEWNNRYGHRRWGQAYHTVGYTGSNNTFVEIGLMDLKMGIFMELL